MVTEAEYSPPNGIELLNPIYDLRAKWDVEVTSHLVGGVQIVILRFRSYIVKSGAGGATFRVSHFRFLYFFAWKRNDAKQKPFPFLFASFHETKKIFFASFCIVSLQFFSNKFFFCVCEPNLRWF